MNHPLRFLAPIATALMCAFTSSAATYRVGDIVDNFSLVNRAGGQPINLTDFAGKIVVLDWFAWWCPFCQAAAPQLLSGVDEHYTQRNGNPAGIPVVHVGINLQPNQEAQTQNFVTKAGLDLVLHDFNRALANRFFSGGQPLFAIINCATNSSSHRPWELIYARQGYGQTTFPVADFRAAIDGVTLTTIVKIPSSLSAPEIAASGEFGFELTGTAGRTYRVESSVDLRDWREERTIVPSASVTVVQLTAGHGEARFVRVVEP